MIKINWSIYHLKTTDDIINLLNLFNRCKPTYGGLDTESTGLHIVLDKPFVVTFGWYNQETSKGDVFSYDLEANPELNRQFFKVVYKLLGQLERVILWNATFDMHMLTNIDYPYPHRNLTDAMGYVRLAHDAIPVSRGGVPMNLKDYAVRYIDPNAKVYLNAVRSEQTALLKERTNKIKSLGYTIKYLNEIMGDKINEVTDLPKEVQEIYRTSPDPDNYANIPRDKLIKYACYDVIYTIEAFHQCKPVIEYRKQESVIQREEDLIYVLYKMERTGFKLNKKYILESKETLKNYIIRRRAELVTLVGRPLKVGQHKAIKEWLFTKGIIVDSTDNASLEALKENKNPVVSKVATIITELRTLEKWYSTYIIKWLKDIDRTDRIYTQINQFSAVSARVSSDFQQFPRDAIKDDDGNEIFNPRKIVSVSGGEYPAIFYLDYSQIELRIQALYTILVGEGDLNLCRAYMPFKCKRLETLPNGTKNWLSFDFNSLSDIRDYPKYKWFLEENLEIEWHPTDLHSATTQAAFPDLKPGTDEFKHHRKYGKSTNFACNYGASASTLHLQFGYSEELANRLYNAYQNTFPGIGDYRNYVKHLLYTKPYVTNLFNRRYYGMSYHNACSDQVQGSAADFLKIKMIEVDKFLVDNNCRTRFQMNIHDEMSFELYQGEEWIIPKIKKIMEDLPGTKVPIVADVEITYTTWAEKEDYNIG